jgi:hypothetical protein
MIFFVNFDRNSSNFIFNRIKTIFISLVSQGPISLFQDFLIFMHTIAKFPSLLILPTLFIHLLSKFTYFDGQCIHLL